MCDWYNLLIIESRMDLTAVTRVAQKAADSVVSMGVSLGRSSVPGREAQQEAFPDDEMEFGMGIHILLLLLMGLTNFRYF
jgi:dihydroxyacetone kinase